MALLPGTNIIAALLGELIDPVAIVSVPGNACIATSSTPPKLTWLGERMTCEAKG